MKFSNWKRKAGLSLAITAVLISIVGCSSESDKKSEASPAETELTVLLDWYPNAVHTFLYAAEEQGYFKEAGLKVNLVTPADTNDALKLVATGKADLALSYQMQVAIARAEDIPVVSVGAIVRHPLNQLMVLDSDKISSPKDLVGQKIGYPSIPLDQAIVNTMVQTDGGDPSKIAYTDVSWDLIPSMTTKRVDAIIGGYINHEKLLLEKDGVKVTAFDPAQFGVPDYYELVLTASEDGLTSKGDAIKKFVEASAKGQQYTQEHPAEALQLLLDKQNSEFPLEADIEKKSLDILLPLMDAGQEPFGSQSEQSWTTVIEWLTEHGQLSKDIKAADAFRNL
ncbi:putative hydroxymethylpyrimidine transport system substrate-binding protein [Paenibacillus cellulosilyticus]|uniref:Putative hydroxymethylpyrimidine transport system substrate-binding protein n=1 Tax=Paenibacillus cellulosilyticus TaxID=375489 RepID=A0A2V2YUK3_9BACL|nr:putative hydroxymethylpyrimidine transport system substrate-binding protein [Paenibacillus cellulosilyticus]